MKWFRPAAEQGNAKAQYNLGVMYELGQGVPQDYADAVKWYRLAAEQGEVKAQGNLGGMYGDGQGVPQDYVMSQHLIGRNIYLRRVYLRRLVGDALGVSSCPLPEVTPLRDQRLATIRTGGRMAWQVSSGYNQRSRGETLMSRWKMVIGPKLQARNFPNQKTEAKIGSHILNNMTELGRPEFDVAA